MKKKDSLIKTRTILTQSNLLTKQFYLEERVTGNQIRSKTNLDSRHNKKLMMIDKQILIKLIIIELMIKVLYSLRNNFVKLTI